MTMEMRRLPRILLMRPDKERSKYDTPDGVLLRLHQGHCPRAWTKDGECSCHETAPLMGPDMIVRASGGTR